jgi:predicted secreted hydrolase
MKTSLALCLALWARAAAPLVSSELTSPTVLEHPVAAAPPVASTRPVAATAPEPPPTCRLALSGYRYLFPRDHFAHPDFRTEWWYYTGNLRSQDGRRFGFELTFFRQAADGCSDAQDAGSSVWTIRNVYLAHFALSDLDGDRFVHEQRVNRAGPGLAGANGNTGTIWNGNWSAQIAGDAHRLEAVADRFDLRLTLVSQKPPVIHGRDGVSPKAAEVGRASHYVSLTRMGAAGEVQIDGLRLRVEGSAWMDHEFFTDQLASGQSGWDWLGLQLDDGTDLMLYRLRAAVGRATSFAAGTLVAKDGRITHLTSSDFTLSADGAVWTSPQTQATYPIAWRVSLPSRGLDLVVTTPLPAQELAGRVGWTPTYWEGAVAAQGTRNGSPVTGVGYLELTGYDKPVTLP